jgi:hypothetical protein
MSAIKLSTPSSGSISLSPADTASNLTITVPAVTGTMITTASTFAGTGPAFSAYKSSSQTITNNTWTKITFETEEFDTNSNFASSRFTPTIAGYYQVNFELDVGGVTASLGIAGIYKNGVDFKRGQGVAVSGISEQYLMGSCLIYLNGSTDYIEVYAYVGASSSATVYGGQQTYGYFQASMVRAA